MLAPARVDEARQLIDEGKLSQRKIARLLGMSRATVSAIASGKRPDYVALRLARCVGEEPQGPLERCPTCGGRVYMPCRLCRVRRITAREQLTAKVFRRHAREQSLKRLLNEVARIAAHDQSANTAAYLAADAPAMPSDCK